MKIWGFCTYYYLFRHNVVENCAFLILAALFVLLIYTSLFNGDKVGFGWYGRIEMVLVQSTISCKISCEKVVSTIAAATITAIVHA